MCHVFFGDVGDFILEINLNCDIPLINGSNSGFYGYCVDAIDSDNGIFVRWISGKGFFKLETDWLGMYPIYYWKRDENSLFISNSLGLINSYAKEEVDSTAITMILTLGYVLNERTVFTNIKRPEGKFEFQIENKIASFNSGYQSFEGEHSYASYKDFNNILKEELSKIRKINKDIFLPLTGGRDSRHIFLTLNKLKINIKSTYTARFLSPLFDDDCLIAKKLSDLFGVKHICLPPELNLVEAEISKLNDINFESLDHAWANPCKLYLKSLKADCIIVDGFGGDVLSQSKLVSEEFINIYKSGDFALLADRMVNNNSYLTSFLRGNYLDKRHLENCKDELVIALDKCKSLGYSLKMFYLFNRSRRSTLISSVKYLNANSIAYMPFVHKNVVKFLLSVSDSDYLSGFHDKAISYSFNEISEIEYASNNTPASNMNFFYRIKNFIYILKLLKKSNVLYGKSKIRYFLVGMKSLLKSEDFVRYFYFSRIIIFISLLDNK